MPVAQGTAGRMQQDAQAYKAQVVAMAQGQAARFNQLEGAYAQAPEVTRRAHVHGDDREGAAARTQGAGRLASAGGNMIYLPIDKLLEKSTSQRVRGAVEHGAGGERRARRSSPESVTIEARGRGER